MFSKETRIMQLEARKHLLMARDPSMNMRLIKKIERELRKIKGE